MAAGARVAPGRAEFLLRNSSPCQQPAPLGKRIRLAELFPGHFYNMIQFINSVNTFQD